MRKVTITRLETGDDGTFGKLVTDSGFSIYTGELPWRGDIHDYSCIPAGAYPVTWRYSEAHKKYCYHIEDIKRPGTEIHAGNWCGDVTKGRKSNVKGCVITGRALGVLADQPCVMSSRDALAGLENDLERENFILQIVWGFNGPETKS